MKEFFLNVYEKFIHLAWVEWIINFCKTNPLMASIVGGIVLFIIVVLCVMGGVRRKAKKAVSLADTKPTEERVAPKMETIVEEVKAEPVIEETIEPIIEEVKVEPVVEETIEPIIEEVKAEPVIEETAEPIIEEVKAEPVVEETIEPIIEEVKAEPVIEEPIEPIIEEVKAEPVVEETAEPIIEEVKTEPVVEEPTPIVEEKSAPVLEIVVNATSVTEEQPAPIKVKEEPARTPPMVVEEPASIPVEEKAPEPTPIEEEKPEPTPVSENIPEPVPVEEKASVPHSPDFTPIVEEAEEPIEEEIALPVEEIKSTENKPQQEVAVKKETIAETKKSIPTTPPTEIGETIALIENMDDSVPEFLRDHYEEGEMDKIARHTGKWVVCRVLTDAAESEEMYFFELHASNGEKLLSSEEYNTYQGALRGIETVKTNILNGNIKMTISKKGDFLFKILSGKNMLLCLGESYPSMVKCQKAIVTTKRFAQTAILDENIQDIVIKVPQEGNAPLPAIPENSVGKWIIFSRKDTNKQSIYYFELFASNGESLLTSEHYSTYIGAINGIQTFKSNIQKKNIRIALTKRGDYVYKLLNANGQLLYLGEHYRTKRICEYAVALVKQFALSSPVLTEENPEDKK